MATELGLKTRALKIELDDLRQLSLPCVLHWNMNHFVVLKAVGRANIVIHDPAAGIRRISIREASQCFTGVVLELAPSPDFQKKNKVSTQSIFSLMGRVVGLKRSALRVLAFGLALQLCALIAPFFTQLIVDDAIVSIDQHLVAILGIGFILLALIETSIMAARSWVATTMSTQLNFQWLSNVFAHLLKLPIPFFEKRNVGDIVSRFGSISIIQQSLTASFIEAILDGILAIATLILILIYSIKLSLIALATVMIYFMIRLLLLQPTRQATSEYIVHSARQQTYFIETVRAIQSIRLFGRSDVRHSEWMNRLVEQFNAGLMVSRFSISYQVLNNCLLAVERIVVLWLGALEVIENTMSLGMLLAFIAYKDQFRLRAVSLIDKVIEFKVIEVHSGRVAEIVTATPQSDQSDVKYSSREFAAPTIELRNVSFRYSDSEPYIIKDFSLKIDVNSCVAIVGRSGSGKTTLLKLMLGLLRPSEGAIYIDTEAENSRPIPVSEFGFSNYLSLIGAVMQDDQLLAGTIRSNISFFDPAPSIDDIHRCAKLAAVYDEINAMPMGFDSIIGEMGVGLSGGQKQRLLLARALYKGPKILILDEATSHLDIHNEYAVNAAIRQLNLIRVIVAHRQETINMADRIITLEQGRIVSDKDILDYRNDLLAS